MNDIKYIELKSGYSDDGPAWIGKVGFSKSGRTIYFNGHAFRGNGHGYARDVQNGDLYWISGVKKNGEDRHWAGRGVIQVEKEVVEDYLNSVDFSRLDPQKYILVDVEKIDKNYFNDLQNEPLK
ncbi:MAG: mannose-1-phosphate guanylyltransferase [Dysgonomonas sp.]